MLSRRKENRILIGMPGCGKSTVGRALAQLLDRPFVDCDAELEKALGMPPGSTSPTLARPPSAPRRPPC